MPLQVRLIDVLGQRTLDLPERPVDHPLVVGRASDADVQIPSTSVSRRHCLLAVYEGQWTIQDAGSSGGTFVNGQPVTASMYLQSGDVVSLGSGADAARLEIDPFGAERVLSGTGAVATAATTPFLPQPHSLPPNFAGAPAGPAGNPPPYTDDLAAGDDNAGFAPQTPQVS